MYLSLVFHNHQPVGQLPWAFDDAWNDSYAPFLDVLERHPTVRVALHYTGPLLEWLSEYKPKTLAKVRKLVEQGQVEILAGGFYEPILAIWPHADQVAQITQLRDAVQAMFGTAPRGLWLAERVWEPGLAAPILETGLNYTFVDSTVFEAAGIAEKESFGYCSVGIE
jgi:alpha-amylase